MHIVRFEFNACTQIADVSILVIAALGLKKFRVSS